MASFVKDHSLLHHYMGYYPPSPKLALQVAVGCPRVGALIAISLGQRSADVDALRRVSELGVALTRPFAPAEPGYACQFGAEIAAQAANILERNDPQRKQASNQSNQD